MNATRTDSRPSGPTPGSRPRRRLVLVFLAALVFVGPRSAEAGVFRNLLDKVGKTMEDYNRDMWTGENSVGKTPFKKGGGGFFKRFEDTAAAMGRAQDNAKANVKAVWEAVKDIVLWLPRKIGAAFGKLMDKVRNFMGKLGQMNQGATVKDRWKNLVGVSNGAGGGGAGVQSFAGGGGGGFDDALSGGEGGDLPTDELDALLDGGDEALGSVDAEEAASGDDYADILAELGEGEPEGARPSDAPGAPSDSSDADAFSKMFRLSGAVEASQQRREAKRRIRLAYVSSLDETLGKGQAQAAAELILRNGELYKGNVDGMQKAMGILARRHPKYAAGLQKAARRLGNLARRASQSP